MGEGSGSRLDVETTMMRFEPMTATRLQCNGRHAQGAARQLMAVLTEPYTPGYFECPTCDRSDSAVVKFT
jgi:hypothetical protein